MKTTVAPYQTATWCVRIECTNGTIVRLTSHPVDLVIGADTYRTDYGYEPSAFSATASMSPSAIDLEGIVAVSGVSRDALASGVFDNARVYIFRTNYLSPVVDEEKIAAGFFGKTTLENEHYRIEGISIIDALNQSTGLVYQASCPRTFGDAGCGISLAAIDVVGAVNVVTSSSVIRDTSRTEAADWFTAGTIQFTSGLNAGLKALEIKSYASDGTITTFEPFFYMPQVGDTFVMIPGCRKRLEDCRDKWNNVINYLGFTHIPTQSTYMKVET